MLVWRSGERRRAAQVALGCLVAVTAALPLAVLAASGSSLFPGAPRYVYGARPGDAFGYHAAVRELLATPLRLGWALPLVGLLLVTLGAVAVRWRRHPSERPLLALVAVWCLATIATLFVLRMRYSGAPTIGWPLVWSVPLFPYRALGLPLDPDVAFGFGLVLSLAANAASVVATYLLGLWSTGRRGVGLLAAGLLALSPLLLLALGETRDLDTWQVDLGLAMYSEPVSTALVTAGCALIVRRGSGPIAATVAGGLLGLAVTVRLSNALVAAAVFAFLLLRREHGAAIRLAATGLAFLPVVLAYWPMGYESLPPDTFRDDPFGLAYAVPAWRDSIVWGARAAVVLLPLAVVGSWRVRRDAAALLWSWVLATALFYTFYFYTPLHPRFLLVVLPALLVLWSAGALSVAGRLGRGRHGSFISRP